MRIAPESRKPTILWHSALVVVIQLLLGGYSLVVHSFHVVPTTRNRRQTFLILKGTKGFGSGGDAGKKNNKKRASSKNRLIDSLDDDKKKPRKAKKAASAAKPFVKDEQDQLLEQLARQSATTPIGRAVAEFSPVNDDFWELMPSLIASRFANVKNDQLERIAGFVRHTLATAKAGAAEPQRPTDWIDDPYRPYQELHAYMPGLGPTKPFHDTSTLPLCQLLQDNYETIREEYQALLDNNMQDKFQSVTSMNYDSGWQTLVLFYNGHRIPGFPYHLCPVTTQILETVPLAGRIAGFNRQQPGTGIPLHTDGNNMWLTCQMGIDVPSSEAYIRVGRETRHWENGKCLLYDTTYEHETMNANPTQERVVLHVDFFNTLAMTAIEIEIMQYIYSLREEFMKAEGVAKVGAQIL